MENDHSHNLQQPDSHSAQVCTYAGVSGAQGPDAARASSTCEPLHAKALVILWI